MAMDPIKTKKKIESDYTEYLSSILQVRDDEINKKTKVAIKTGRFVKGPYLEATLPFTAGMSLKELADKDIISREFECIREDIHYERPLYYHQQKAVEKLSGEDKNIIVATGTGSGKTECYMFPIFNYLMREKEAGKLGPGVRALLLFPMNALANDQVKKLRQLLANYPDITFGRYTGETERTKTEEEVRKEYKLEHGEDALPNEMLTRKRMQNTPPHILLTNYAMLEYLLLRPTDSELFDGSNAKSWKFIVIDEAHTYKGSNGTEIAILLRRLKERINKHSDNKLTCVATSATLGSEDSKDALATFAENIFDEPFMPEDIVTASRIRRKMEANMTALMPEDYVTLKTKVAAMEGDEKGSYLYERLVRDSRIIGIQNALMEKPMNAEDIADAIFDDVSGKGERIKAFVDLVELATCAKEDANSNALLPARYHLFVKSLEGMFAAFYPKKEIFLERKASTNNNAGKIKVFELANCQSCEQEYIVGRIIDSKLELPNDREPKEFFLMENVSMEFDEDEELEQEKEADIKGMKPYKLCTVCGDIHPADEKHENCCECLDNNKYITVYRLMKKRDNAFEVNGCAKCGSVSPGILKRFFTANHAATFTVANSLYEAIPPKKSEKKDEELSMEDFSNFFSGDNVEINSEIKDERGRKLLIFSDNRQEAAFFAGYLANRHEFIMWRRIILTELKKYPEGVFVGDLIKQVKVAAEKNNLYTNYENPSDNEKMNIAARYVLYEFMESDKKTGLAGRGYIEIYPDRPEFPKGLWGLSKDDMWNLLRFYMDTLRTACAINFPDTLSYEDDFFAPRNREVGFRLIGGTSVIKAFLPAEGRKNKRTEFARKVINDDGNINKYVSEGYKLLVEGLGKKGYFTKRTLEKYPSEGEVYRVDYRKWKMRYIEREETLFRCKKCGAVSAYSIDNKCQSFKCDGELEEVRAEEIQQVPYYYDLYSTKKIIPMIAKEHTAQLSRRAAGKYQEKFERGDINVLSCSTTFEMGVDVGELEATFLRNVPPETANYIQRAGRAGRRTSSTAFAVTFARRNSHDINYYNKPEAIISGKIKPPYIEINNDKIAIRHINSIIMAWFFSKNPGMFGNVEILINGDGKRTAAQMLKDMLDEKPSDVIEAIKTVLPKDLELRMNIDSWDFAERIAGNEGTLTVALKQRSERLSKLQEIIMQRVQEERGVKTLQNLVRTLKTERCIDFLASSGVLPKYGFPVDVVNLDIANNSVDAGNIDLSRDLKMAIGEFCPPSKIIANGHVWKSHVINAMPGKGWPEEYYFECTDPTCGRIVPAGDEYQGIDPKEQKEAGKTCSCGREMKLHKFIVPIFGFSTSIEDKPKRVGEEKPRKYYTTRTLFWGVDELDSYQQEQRIETSLSVSGKQIPIVYTPNGKLTVINKGRSGKGLFVCNSCGYVDENRPVQKHRNKYGDECKGNMSLVSLGHTFNSDILKITLPHFGGNYSRKTQLTSTLYAILEGASEHLEIDRDDINGCISYENGTYVLILYDESAGGAGHVKRIARHMEGVLKNAMDRVKGSCGCSEDTSCYGCLRNYGNQFEHDDIKRGAAKEYLEWILS